MQIVVNNQKKQVDSINLNQLLSELDIPIQGIAVAVNQVIISRNGWSETILNELDHVTIIKATRGG